MHAVGDLIKTRVATWSKAKFDVKIYKAEDFEGNLDGIRRLKL